MTRSRLDALIMSQEHLDKLTRADIERVQLQKLNSLLRREKERNGFYKDLPEALASLQELRYLPFTAGDDLALHGGRMLLLSQGEVDRVITGSTSGSTGPEKRVFYTAEDCEDTVGLFMAGIGEFVFPGSVTMVCMPYSGGEYGLGELISEAIRRLGALPLPVGIGRSYGELADIINESCPDTYIGMPVALLSMLRVLGRKSLRRALVSGDACPETVMREIESILGSRLYPHYGSREMCLGGAVTCRCHSGMHLRENHVIAEIVNEEGDVLPKGEWGELVITTVGMRAQPLIRYKTGDYTRIIPGICPCGSETLRLDIPKRLFNDSITACLDEKLFTINSIIDYYVNRNESNYDIFVLTDGEISTQEMIRLIESVGFAPGRLTYRPYNMDDRALYLGKRV